MPAFDADTAYLGMRTLSEWNVNQNIAFTGCFTAQLCVLGLSTYVRTYAKIIYASFCAREADKQDVNVKALKFETLQVRNGKGVLLY